MLWPLIFLVLGPTSGYGLYFFQSQKLRQERDDLDERLAELYTDRVSLITEIEDIERTADARVRPKIHEVTGRIKQFL